MSDGISAATAFSAPEPVPTARTAYPAFFRYSETNEAIDCSSSTTRTDWGALMATPP